MRWYLNNEKLSPNKKIAFKYAYQTCRIFSDVACTATIYLMFDEWIDWSEIPLLLFFLSSGKVIHNYREQKMKEKIYIKKWNEMGHHAISLEKLDFVYFNWTRNFSSLNLSSIYCHLYFPMNGLKLLWIFCIRTTHAHSNATQTVYLLPSFTEFKLLFCYLIIFSIRMTICIQDAYPTHTHSS